jgi:hypothetical protein
MGDIAYGENDCTPVVDVKFSEEPSLETLRKLQRQFANEREWDQYHTPRNLVLALVRVSRFRDRRTLRDLRGK